VNHPHLPTLLAALRQEQLDGELVLEQNDGLRRLYWRRGELVYLQSEVAGEQFGNYLLRQGILDYPALQSILASVERFRLGEKVVQWGMMSITERDDHLRLLQEQVMVNALEHPIHRLDWNPGPLTQRLSGDLQLQLDHRHFIWNTFLEAQHLPETLALLQAETCWAWSAIPDLLDTLSDLPLTPATAYALSFLGPEPISFDTFLSLSNLDDEEAARILLSLWAVGGLTLAQGELPTAALAQPPPEAASRVEPAATPATPLPLEQQPPTAHTEFPDPEASPPLAFSGVQSEPSPLERARTLYRKARQLREGDRIGEAIRCLEQSVQLDPGSEAAYGVWLLLGQLRMSNPAWSTRAVTALQAAARLRPRAPEPWVSMAEVYFRKGFRTNAAACFRKALELDPSVPIPPDVDLRSLEAPALPGPPAPTSLFSRFRSILGGSDKN